MNTQAIESDVLLARDGDEAAFRRLVERSASTVCSIALAIVRNVHASEDIAQETFLAAWANLRNLRNPSSFLPWLRQMTRNQAHLWHRRHDREIADDASLAAAADPRPLAVHSVIAEEEQRILEEVLNEIPDESREVIILYYREGRSTAQVALLLDISEEAVRQRLSRSRSLIREQMLGRFGEAATRTAPGTIFVAAVAGALTTAAPASAAVVASTGAATAGTIAKASLLGAITAWAGILLGMRYLQPVFDEQEGRELRRFRNVVLSAVTVGSFVIAWSAHSTLAMLFAIQGTYGAIIYLYAVRLPRILERRMAWERTKNPEVARQHRRQWMWATISTAASAALSGTVVMAIILRALSS